MNITTLRELTIIISSVLTFLTVIVYFLRNFAYGLFDSDIGIKKDSKATVILEMLIKTLIFLTVMIIVYAFSLSNDNLQNIKKVMDIKNLLHSLSLFIITILYLLIIYYRQKKIINEKDLYFRTYTYNPTKFNLFICKNRYSISIISDIILSFIGIQIYFNNKNVFFLVIYLCNILILSFMWYGFEEAFFKLINLKENSVYCIDSEHPKICKIIKSDDTYTTLLVKKSKNSARLEHIKTSNIISICQPNNLHKNNQDSRKKK